MDFFTSAKCCRIKCNLIENYSDHIFENFLPILFIRPECCVHIEEKKMKKKLIDFVVWLVRTSSAMLTYYGYA